MNFYKVLRRKDDKLFSAVVIGDAALEYKTDCVIKPVIPHSQLFVFNNLESAMRFRSGMTAIPNAEIWEVECSGITVLVTICALPLMEAYTAFWRDGKLDLYFMGMPPTGTLGCYSLRLIKKCDLT